MCTGDKVGSPNTRLTSGHGLYHYWGFDCLVEPLRCSMHYIMLCTCWQGLM